MKKITFLLAAVLCLAACEDKTGFLYDKVYDDPDIFGLPLRMEAPTQITNDGATFKIMLKTRENITSRGLVIAEDSFSQYPEVVYSDATGNVYEITVDGLRPGTEYFVRAFCVTESGDVSFSLEQEFTTLGQKDNWITVSTAPSEGYVNYENGYYIDEQGYKYKYAFVWELTLSIAREVDDTQIAEVGFEREGRYQPLSRTWPFSGMTYTKKNVVFNQDGAVDFAIRGYIRYKDDRFIYSDYHRVIMIAK